MKDGSNDLSVEGSTDQIKKLSTKVSYIENSLRFAMETEVIVEIHLIHLNFHISAVSNILLQKVENYL